MAEETTSAAAPAAWERHRQDFPILRQQVRGHPLVYLDNAATTQKPLAVLNALQAYYAGYNANVHRGIHTLSQRATDAYEAARARAARFLGAASPAEIIFTRGTTESINLVAQTWGLANLKPGDRIVLTEMEHHSNIVPWQLLAKRTGASLAYLPVTQQEGLLDSGAARGLLAGGIKLLAVTHVSNTLGTINPVADLCAQARAAGAVTLVDAAQSAGHMPIDVRLLGCDFLACSGHKMAGPTGIGVLYGRQELLEAMPPWQGGGDMIATVDFHESTWNELPHKFEAGTPNIAGAVGLHAAMDYLDQLGRRNIARHDGELAGYALERLAGVPGLRVLGPRSLRAGVISFLMEDAHAHDVVTLADERGVALRGGHHCNQPLMKKLGITATARASFYLYNTKGEIDRLAEVLRDIQRFFSR